jgi:hypothetical protein
MSIGRRENEGRGDPILPILPILPIPLDKRWARNGPDAASRKIRRRLDSEAEVVKRILS